MSRDDEQSGTEIPTPDAPADRREKRQAEDLAGLVDSVLEGDRLPPAMDPDQRALLDVASMIVASSRPIELPAGRALELVDEALRRAGASRRPASISSMHKSAEFADVKSLDEARETSTTGAPEPVRWAGLMPWAVAAVASAAAIGLWFAQPGSSGNHGDVAATVRPSQLEETHQSRPSDTVVGMIARADSGEARNRVDAIFADRMGGYRDLGLRPSVSGGVKR